MEMGSTDRGRNTYMYAPNHGTMSVRPRNHQHPVFPPLENTMEHRPPRAIRPTISNHDRTETRMDFGPRSDHHWKEHIGDEDWIQRTSVPRHGNGLPHQRERIDDSTIQPFKRNAVGSIPDSSLRDHNIPICIGIIAGTHGVAKVTENTNLRDFLDCNTIRPGTTFSPSILVTLTDVLVSFSYIDVQSDHIMSLTIVDVPNNDPILLVSANSGHHRMNSDILDRVCTFYSAIFMDLENLRLHKKGSYATQRDILFRVLALASAKIIPHLGLIQSPALVHPPGYQDGGFGAHIDNRNGTYGRSVRNVNSSLRSTPVDLRKYIPDLIAQYKERERGLLATAENAARSNTRSQMMERGIGYFQELDEQLVDTFGPYSPQGTSNITTQKLYDAVCAVAWFVIRMGDSLTRFFEEIFPANKHSDKDNLIRRLGSIADYVKNVAFLCNLAAGNVRRGVHERGTAAASRNAGGDGKEDWTRRVTVSAVKPNAEMYSFCDCRINIGKHNDPHETNCEHKPTVTAADFPFDIDDSMLSRNKKGRQTVTSLLDEIFYSIDKAYGKQTYKPNIHGEVSIAFELARLFPNTDYKFYISSFKKPCALCAALMSSFGCFYHRKSHGKIYGSWRVPSIEYLHTREMAHVLPYVEHFHQNLTQSAYDCTRPAYVSTKSSETSISEELDPIENPHVPKEAYIPLWSWDNEASFY